MKKLVIAASSLCVWAFPCAAQENWAGAPVPPAAGSAGVVSGNEYIVAECNRRAPGNFYCTDNPTTVREVFIPISSFARSTTVDALSRNFTSLTTRVDAQELRLNTLSAMVNGHNAELLDLRRIQAEDRIQARKGIATAVAIGSAPMPSEPGRTSYDVNLATFRGEQALGASLKHRLDLESPTAVSFGFSSAGRGNTAARVGVSGEF